MSRQAEEWKRLFQRALAMSPKELAYRFRQRAAALLDFGRYKSGASFEPRLTGNAPTGEEAHFFFSAAEIPRLCALLRQRFPAASEEIIRRAEHICQHRFDLLGYKDLDYGAEIDWHADRIHGKRAPIKPWFQIRYLDFEQVGDSKITWELNRHQWMVSLAKAYRITANEKFARELFEQWRHWHQENPYPMGINWASSLEVAFRSLSWLWVYFLMSGSAAMPQGFRSELVRKLAISGRHIENHLSIYFSPNTHLLGEATALFFIGTLCPELKWAERWRERGWAILLQEAERQVREDGCHFEQSMYYHVYAVDFFLHSVVLASRNNIAIPAQLERILERMLQTLCVLGRSGPVPSLGDDDGGRLFDPQRNRAEHAVDPLATGAVLFGRGDFKLVAQGPREETLWLLGEAGLAEFERLSNIPVASHSMEFESSGLYVMADDDLGRQLVIDAGPQGADTAGHGHADALSITANLRGSALLIDSGAFQYVGRDSRRNRFRGTKAHNTLVVDRLDQAEPKGPFSWGQLPRVRAEVWLKGETFDFFVGSHEGFMRLPEPVIHRRFVFSRKSGFWLVRDLALGRGKHQLDLFWHLAPGFSPVKEGNKIFRSAKASFAILPTENPAWSEEVLAEFWSPVYGQREPHRVVHSCIVADLPAEFAVLLLPADEVDGDVNTLVRTSSPSANENVICYRFKTAGEDHLVFFGQRQTWKMLPWSSDAEFLYWSQSHDKKRRTLICCNGSYVEAQGQRILSCNRMMSRCEVSWVEGKLRTVSSEPDVVVIDEAFTAFTWTDH